MAGETQETHTGNSMDTMETQVQDSQAQEPSPSPISKFTLGDGTGITTANLSSSSSSGPCDEEGAEEELVGFDFSWFGSKGEKNRSGMYSNATQIADLSQNGIALWLMKCIIRK